MKVTSISVQVRDKSRVNVSIDGVYRFSLDINQVAELGIKKDIDYTEEQLVAFEEESLFGKLYTRTLEYALNRPRSQKELRDYLYRKTRPSRMQNGGIKKGATPALTARVSERILERGYVDDVKFTRFWVENRNMTKGISRRKLMAELQAKGVSRTIIEAALADTERDESEDLKKILRRKQGRYSDEQKLIAYLARQGFSYDAIRSALDEDEDEE